MNSPLRSSRAAKSFMNPKWASTSSGLHWSIGTSLTGAGAPRYIVAPELTGAFDSLYRKYAGARLPPLTLPQPQALREVASPPNRASRAR
jgi:hypothetical protein